MADQAALSDRRTSREIPVRRLIAHAAAKLIAEEGLTDYRAAKLKAARSLGVAVREVLPDNHEIEAAVREHLAIFQRASQPQELHALRKIACEVMRRLVHFSPLLVGPVLTGTANRFSCIELELVLDDMKALDLFLLKENVEYELISNDQHAQRCQYQLRFDGVVVVATIFSSVAQRSRRAKHAGPQIDGAELSQVRMLLPPT